jgi:hypothetical protein
MVDTLIEVPLGSPRLPSTTLGELGELGELGGPRGAAASRWELMISRGQRLRSPDGGVLFLG